MRALFWKHGSLLAYGRAGEHAPLWHYFSSLFIVVVAIRWTWSNKLTASMVEGSA